MAVFTILQNASESNLHKTHIVSNPLHIDSCQGFGDSNRDALRPDLVVILQNAGEKMLSHLFPEVIDLDDKRAPITAGGTIRSQVIHSGDYHNADFNLNNVFRV